MNRAVIARPAREMQMADMGIPGTPRVARAKPPTADPRAWPIELTDPFTAMARGAPWLVWMIREDRTGISEKSEVEATKIARATST